MGHDGGMTDESVDSHSLAAVIGHGAHWHIWGNVRINLYGRLLRSESSSAPEEPARRSYQRQGQNAHDNPSDNSRPVLVFARVFFCCSCGV